MPLWKVLLCAALLLAVFFLISAAVVALAPYIAGATVIAVIGAIAYFAMTEDEPPKGSK